MQLIPRSLRRRAAQGWYWLAHVGFPFHLKGRDATAMMIRRRRFGRRAILNQWPLSLRPFAMLAMMLCWPLGAALQVRALMRGDTTPGGQLEDAPQPFDWGLWRTAVRHSISAVEAYKFGVADRGAPSPDAWLYDLETARSLAALSSKTAINLAHDKAAFATFCAEADLPHVPTLAYWQNGEGTEVDPTAWPDAIVLKPATASNAQGLEVWRLRDDSYRNEGYTLDAITLSLRAAALSKVRGAMLAQPCLVLHPDLSALGLTGMPTVRLSTGLWPDGRCAVLDAYLSAPLPGRLASNQGIGAYWSIALETGQIGPSQSPLLPAWMGETAIDGTLLPDWTQACDSALAGHTRFPGPIPILGWDVAFTDQGPVMIEANTGIGFSFEQAIRQRPATDGATSDLLDAWITA